MSPQVEVYLKMHRKILVVAGNYQEFENWRYEHGLNRHQVMYVNRHDHIMGCERGTTLYTLVGTWDYRPYKDISTILALLKTRATYVEV